MAQLEQDEERLTPAETGDDLSNDPAIQQMAKDLENTPVQTPPEELEDADNQPEAPAPVQSQASAAVESPKHPKSRSMTIVDTGETSVLNPIVYVQMKQLAADFVKSGAMPKCWDTPEAILVGLQTGIEMGMKPMEAMNSLYFVSGHINLWGKATIRRFKEHGWSISYTESDGVCEATVQKGSEKYTEKYTFSEAEQSGYTKDGSGRLKVGWQLGINRRVKLRYGALSIIAKTYVPEILGAAEGIAEVDTDGYDASRVHVENEKTDTKTETTVAKALADKKKKDKLEPAPVEA